MEGFYRMNKGPINYKRNALCKLSNTRADGGLRTHAQSLDLATLGAVNGFDTTRTYVKGSVKNLVKCPICSTNIIVSQLAHNDIDFPHDNMNRTSIPRLLISNENGINGVLCETCNNEEPEVICVECDQQLCFICTRAHLRATATRRHHITGITEKEVVSPLSKKYPVTASITEDVIDSVNVNGLASSYEGYHHRAKIEDPRTSQIRYSDIYQRGNSPRASDKQRKFEFKHVQPKGWGTDFSLMNSFDVGSYVLSMCAASRDQCWVSMAAAIHLYNMEGQRLKCIDMYTEVRDMIVNKATDDIYISCFADKSIKVVNSDEETVTNFLSLPLHPAGIAVNSYGDIVICGVEDFRRRYRPEHRNRLLIYTREGKLKREIERDHNGKIFHYPEYIDVNINGDMCVSDIENESLVVLREDGRLKTVYKGPAKGMLVNKFDPRDVCCDKEGNIIVCDINNSALHLLDVNGAFIRILLSEQDGIYWPDILAIDHRNHIWVRELWQQSIKVFQSLGTY